MSKTLSVLFFALSLTFLAIGCGSPEDPSTDPVASVDPGQTTPEKPTGTDKQHPACQVALSVAGWVDPCTAQGLGYCNSKEINDWLTIDLNRNRVTSLAGTCQTGCLVDSYTATTESVFYVDIYAVCGPPGSMGGLGSHGHCGLVDGTALPYMRQNQKVALCQP